MISSNGNKIANSKVQFCRNREPIKMQIPFHPVHAHARLLKNVLFSTANSRHSSDSSSDRPWWWNISFTFVGKLPIVCMKNCTNSTHAESKQICARYRASSWPTIHMLMTCSGAVAMKSRWHFYARQRSRLMSRFRRDDISWGRHGTLHFSALTVMFLLSDLSFAESWTVLLEK